MHDAPDTKLPPIRFSFSDYVLATRRQGEGAAARAYWEARLDTLPGPPDLPVLPGEPATLGFLRHEAVMPIDQWRAFEAGAAKYALTPNAALIAAFAESLAVWAAQPEFCLNITLASRKPLHADVSRLVGDFTGNLLLAVPDRADAAFAAHAGAIARQLAADIEHADHSAVQVLGALSRRQRRTVQMPIVFTALQGYGAVLKRPVRIDAIGRYVAGAAHPAGLARRPGVGNRGRAASVLGCARGHLRPRSAGGHVRRLRRSRAAPRHRPDRLGNAARRGVALPRRDATAARLSGEPIFAGILRHAARAPEAEAVIAPDRRLRFGELVREATDLAARLRAEGVRPGTSWR